MALATILATDQQLPSNMTTEDIKDYKNWPFPTKYHPLIPEKQRQKQNKTIKPKKEYPGDMPDALI